MNKISFLLLIIIAYISCNKAAPPFLSVESSPLKIINDSTFTSELILKNSGDKPLVIEDYSSSCDCTLISLKSGETIQGGKSILVPLRILKSQSDSTNKIITIVFKSNTKPILKTIKFSI